MILGEAKINAISNYFKTKPVLIAYIFGSYARGEADNLGQLFDLTLYKQNIFLQRQTFHTTTNVTG